MNECIRSKVVTVRPNDKPWYDSEIRRFTKYRDRQRSIARKRNSQVHWSKYKKLRNKVNNLKTFVKSRFFTNIENQIEDYSVNTSKKYWKSIKDVMKNEKL